MSPVVRLRPTRPSEAAGVAAWEREPANAPYVIPWSVRRHTDALRDPDLRHFIVEFEGEAVGFVLLAGMQNVNDSIELRRIVVSRKGRGYGRAAIEAVKRFSFVEAGAHRLWLDVLESNDRARRLYGSCGFREEGLLRECLRVEDGFVSLVLMSMLTSEYEPEEEQHRSAIG